MCIRLAILLTTATVTTTSVPAAPLQCTPPMAMAATRTHWASVRNQFSKVTDREPACRAYAASFYESVTVRQAAVGCTSDAEITALDSEINAFNELLATKCGGWAVVVVLSTFQRLVR